MRNVLRQGDAQARALFSYFGGTVRPMLFLRSAIHIRMLFRSHAADWHARTPGTLAGHMASLRAVGIYQGHCTQRGP